MSPAQLWPPVTSGKILIMAEVTTPLDWDLIIGGFEEEDARQQDDGVSPDSGGDQDPGEGPSTHT